jgi:hypothetical protein
VLVLKSILVNFRSVFNESIGVAGGELASTFVVSRMVISAENDRPQGQTNRWP